jgi:hypothetical protein
MKVVITPRGRAALRLLLEATILIFAYLAYEAVRRFLAPSSGEAFGHAFNIIQFEQQLGIFFEPSLQGVIVDHHWLVTFFNWVYVWGYLPVIGGAALYLYVFHHDFYTRYRNAFLLSGAIGLIIFATVPVAPPRMFPELGFVDTVRDHSQVYRSFEGSDLVNEFAAVPSFHFGWILLVAMALIQTSRNIFARAGALAMPCVMLLSILLTANHFVLDAVIGGVLVLGALGVVRACEQVRLPQWRPALMRRDTQSPLR